MENTEVMNEVVETAVEDGAEKVVEVSGSKVGIAVGAILAAGALVGGYFYYKKKKAKKEAITVEATEVKTEEKKDSEEPKEN